jgi:hypothetical protein
MVPASSSFLHTWADASSTLHFIQSMLQLSQSMLKKATKRRGHHVKRKGSMEGALIDDSSDIGSYS